MQFLHENFLILLRIWYFMSDEYFGFEEMGIDEETQAQILTNDEQRDMVNQLQQRTPQVASVQIRNRMDEGSVFTDDERSHPFFMLRGIMRSLEHLITQSRIPANAQDTDWVQTELNSLKEMRMIMRDLLPVYEKYQTQLDENEEDWINNLVDFTFNWIINKFDEETAKEYLKAVESLNNQD